MQYPIIDNLILAYLKNGWTGLDIPETITFISNQLGSGTPSPDNIRPIEGTYIPSYGTVYGGSLNVTTGVLTVDMEMYNPTGNEPNYVQQTDRIAFALPTQYRVNDTAERLCSDFYVATAGTYCYVTTGKTVEELKTYFRQNTVQMVLRLVTPITYQCTSEDINYLLKKYSASILKLPMIKYFPHAVIDALISASTGQQTEEQKEVLRHYLTPLGIGGI